MHDDIREQAKRCAELIEKAQFISALTGAGISTNAGIPDFRGPQGLYVTKKYDADKIFDINCFLSDPESFYQFAKDFITLENRLLPTPTHFFLKNLEESGKLKGIITQNIDSLHHKAGSQKVYEMHGSFWTSHCLDCGHQFSYAELKQRLAVENVPRCVCGGLIKPDVVFFGENVKHLDESFQLADRADLFFVIGTSCVVYPAAMIPEMTLADIVVVNKGTVKLRSANIILSVETDVDEFFKQVAQNLSFPKAKEGTANETNQSCL